MPMERHASRIVIVSGTCTDSPSILISVCLGSGCSGGAGVRLGLGGGVNQIGSDVLTSSSPTPSNSNLPMPIQSHLTPSARDHKSKHPASPGQSLSAEPIHPRVF